MIESSLGCRNKVASTCQRRKKVDDVGGDDDSDNNDDDNWHLIWLEEKCLLGLIFIWYN